MEQAIKNLKNGSGAVTNWSVKWFVQLNFADHIRKKLSMYRKLSMRIFYWVDITNELNSKKDNQIEKIFKF